MKARSCQLQQKRKHGECDSVIVLSRHNDCHHQATAPAVVSPNGASVCSDTRAETPAEAEERATIECRRRRLVRRVQGPCRTYAVGDRIVWEDR